MAVIRYTLLLIVLTLTTFLISPSKAETCTYNDLGDRTCTTSTAGTTTGNILENSTFGTGTTTSTSGWSTDGDEGIHTHGVGSFGQKYNGYVDQGGTLAFEGHKDDNVYQDVDLVGDGHLTQSQINEGFTSTMSADIWFWNNVENTTTLKQTITASDGTVTTQIRSINDHDPNRTWNTGSYVNYSDSYTHNSNTQTDFTIRAEVYNDSAGTTYDSAHYGPDVDNVQLSITTAGATSTTFTPCQDLGTCTDAGSDIADAVNLTTDSGTDLFTDLDTKVDDAFKEVEKLDDVKVEEIKFEVMVEDDLGKIEEVKFDDFVEMQFTSFLEENNLVEDFKEELKVEGISEEQFFDELGDSMMEELGGDMMNEIASLNDSEMMMEEPKMEELKEEEIANEPELEQEEIKEESPEQEVKQEEVKETTETESNANTETTTETKNTSEESMETSEEGKTNNEESNMDENSETEGSETETDNAEAVENEADGNDTTQTDKVDSVSVKVKKIIEKLEKTLKNVDDKVKAVQFVTLKGIQAQGANLSSYNIQLKDSIKLNDGNPDFFNQLNIEQEQIYSNVSLNAYTNNDPISIKQSELKEIDIEKQRLLYEIEKLKKG